MDLDDFLRAQGAELPAIVANVGAKLGLTPDDLLLVVGSVVEGLGTSRSDLDLLLIADAPERSLPVDDEHAFVVGRCLADIRVVPLADVQDLVCTLDEWSHRPWDVSRATKFTDQQRVLLHRLLHGMLVLHGDRSDPDNVPRPAAAALARLKLHVARHLSRTVQVDIAGHRDNGDPTSLVFAAQDLLGHAIDALTASHGLTNPNPKWRSRLLEFVPDDWEASLMTRPSGMTAAELVWELHRAPARRHLGAAVEHALRITAFARAVFLWAERHLVGVRVAHGHPACWPRLDRGAETRMPHFDLDVDFLLSEDGASLGRLNSFGATIPLSPAELAVALLFDGTTTADEAEAVVSGLGLAGAEGPSGIAHALVSRIASSGLCAP